MQLRETGEDYLERILMFTEQKGYARSVDIAVSLGVSKAAVSTTIKRLCAEGYVTMDDQKLLHLTEKGLPIAHRIYDRHLIFEQVLLRMGVDPETAREDACRIEHDVSDETMDAIRRAMRNNA